MQLLYNSSDFFIHITTQSTPQTPTAAAAAAAAASAALLLVGHDVALLEVLEHLSGHLRQHALGQHRRPAVLGVLVAVDG